MAAITRRAYARIGLLGNPSDGYHGKTIAVSVENYHAEVTLTPAERVSFEPHPLHDPHDFADMGALAGARAASLRALRRSLTPAVLTRVAAERVSRNGFYGGVRLLWAICAKYHEHWAATATPLPARGFRLSYDTTIPRQAGLSGSSAIVTAALSCLEAYFGDAYALPRATRPALVLAAESALGITAGLQDRVVQTYEGLVYMDFGEEGVKRQGHGDYTPLDPDTLPQLWLVWCDNPGDSGSVHSTVRARWDAGDDTTRQLMAQVAALAPAGRAALERRDVSRLAALMDANFELRRGLFGDAALGARNVAMVRTAQRCGAGAKFCGSGGAAVAVCPDGAAQEEQLARDCAAAGLRCERVRVRRPE